MGFVRYGENGYLVDAKGKPIYLVGVNYVASYVCTNFWEDWRADVIERDLVRISELGLSAVRVPMIWGFMEPEEGRYNPVVFERFDAFLGICKEHGIYVLPWFLAGVATRNYDVPFRNGRPFFEGHMLEVAESHLKHFVRRYGDEEQILFWDICDEPEFYDVHYGAAKVPYDRRVMVRWVKAMYQAIKSVDKNHLVTLGFGHIASENYGIHIRDMAEILDVMSVTGYPYGVASEGIDLMRNNYFISFCVRFHRLGKPVFTCEAPGFSSILYSEAMLARYFKVVLYSNLINGSTGVMPWVFNDFDQSIWDKCPLDEATFEPSFGIVAIDGRLKPAGEELKKFARFVANNQVTRFTAAETEVAIIVPRGYYSEIGNTFKKLYTSFILAKSCTTDVDFIWDDQNFSRYRLLVISSTTQMTTSVWYKIKEFVRQGGTIYYVFDNKGGLSGYFNELFGVEVQTVESSFHRTELRVKKAWGYYQPGHSIRLTGAGIDELLRVEPTDAEVICELEDGLPGMLRNKYGMGTAYLVTLPVESGFIGIPYQDFVENDVFGLYDVLMDETRVNRWVRCYDNRVEIGMLQDRTTGQWMIVSINHDACDVKTRLHLNPKLLEESRGTEVVDLDTGQSVPILVDDSGMGYLDSYFEPAGVNIYEVR